MPQQVIPRLDWVTGDTPVDDVREWLVGEVAEALGCDPGSVKVEVERRGTVLYVKRIVVDDVVAIAP